MIQSWIINRFESLETASAAAASFEADPRARTVACRSAWPGQADTRMSRRPVSARPCLVMSGDTE